MTNVSMIGWTAWCGELKEKDFIDDDGKKKTRKNIWFKLAVKRRYKMKIKDNEGNVKLDEKNNAIREFPTDFYLINAKGKTAELIDRFVNNYEEKLVNGKKVKKIISRNLYIEGYLENYNAERYKTIFLNLNDKNEMVLCAEDDFEQKFNVTLDYDQTLVNMNFFRLLDNSKSKKNTDKKTKKQVKEKTKEKVKKEYEAIDKIADDDFNDDFSSFGEDDDMEDVDFD